MSTVVTRATGVTAEPVGVLCIEPDLQLPDAGSNTALAETRLEPAGPSRPGQQRAEGRPVTSGVAAVVVCDTGQYAYCGPWDRAS